MKITDILQETSVVGTLVGRSKADVIEELAGVLARDHGEIDRQRLIQALEDRERLNSTALGEGVAIPHGKLPGVNPIYSDYKPISTTCTCLNMTNILKVGRRGRWSVHHFTHDAFYDTMTMIGTRYGR